MTPFTFPPAAARASALTTKVSDEQHEAGGDVGAGLAAVR